MESSRNGSLTALLMFLPLVAVPVIALLRPPPHLDGAAEKPNSEDSLEQFATEFGLDVPPAEPVVENPRAPGGLQDETAWLDPFAEPATPPATNAVPKVGELPSRGTVSGFPEFQPDLSNPFREVPPPPAEISASAVDQLPADGVQASPGSAMTDSTTPAEVVAQLRELGVTRYQWLPVRENQGFGFAAFVISADEAFTVRFSSVHSTRQGAVLDVVQQIAAWRMRTDGDLNSRDNSTDAANGMFP